MRLHPAHHLLLSACLAVLVASDTRLLAADAPPAQSTSRSDPQAQMQWWRAARFGMFLHWGIYAVPADGEWFMQNHAISRVEYEKFAAQFNPTKFDADAWADLARDAGQKYVVITAKHNDGFCMFKTSANPYNVVDATPWHHDPIAALGEACRKRGLHFGCYYSLSCWHSPHQTVASGDPAKAPYHPTSLGGPEQKAAFIADMRAELKDLIASGHPNLIWFDGGEVKGWTPDDGIALHAYLRSLDPALIFNDRAQGGGDFLEAEGAPLKDPAGRDWEMVQTMNGSWGYTAADQRFKSAQEMLRTLIDSASNGGNYLLNIGPTAEGLIPEPASTRLEAMGDWLNTNGDAIYGSSAGPFTHPLAWGRCTQKPGKLYFSVYQWPGDGKLLLPLASPITKAYLLSDASRALTSETIDEGIRVSVPAKMPDPIASVVVVETAGPVKTIDRHVTQAADGSITLTPRAAELHGTFHLTLENDPPNIGGWNVLDDYPEWIVQVRTPGTFSMELTYALKPPADGTALVIIAGDQRIPVTLEPTAGWQAYSVLKLPNLKVLQPGPLTVTFRAKKMPGQGVMNFRALTLKPVSPP